jgi:hypothetical protein
MISPVQPRARVQGRSEAPRSLLSGARDAMLGATLALGLSLAPAHAQVASPPLSDAAVESMLSEAMNDGKLSDLERRDLRHIQLNERDRLSLTGNARISALVDIQEQLGDAEAAKAAASGDILGYRRSITAKRHDAEYETGAVDNYPDTAIPRGLKLSGDEPLAKGKHGEAYLVGHGDKIRHLELKLRPIHEKGIGHGYLATFAASPGYGAEIEKRLAALPESRVIDNSMNPSRTDETGRIYFQEFFDLTPAMHMSYAVRVDRPGFHLEYFPESIARESFRGAVHVWAFGANEQERKANLLEAMKLLGLENELGAPTAEVERNEAKLQLLEQASPQAGYDFRRAIESSGKFDAALLEQALAAARVPPRFVKDVKMSRVSPGHVAATVKGMGEAYRRAGVRALVHSFGSGIAKALGQVIADGVLSSTTCRLEEGVIRRGMSSDEDLMSGGGRSVFTRIITEATGNPAGNFLLVISPEVLDRTDWYNYPSDRWGSTVVGDRPSPSPALVAIAKRKPGLDLAQMAKFASRDDDKGAFFYRSTGKNSIRELNGVIHSGLVGSNEAMHGCGIRVEDLVEFVVPSEADRQTILEGLKASGVKQVNGKPIEDFVKARKGLFEEKDVAPPPAEPKPDPYEYFVQLDTKMSTA